MKKLLPLSLFFILSTCSGMNGLGQLMIDAGELLADAGTGHAQAGPTRLLTADTDLTRLEQGVVSLESANPPVALVSGPLVITTLKDARLDTGATVRVWIAPDAAPCGTYTVWFELNAVAMQNFLVKQGERLCANSNGHSAVLWSGFRPY